MRNKHIMRQVDAHDFADEVLQLLGQESDRGCLLVSAAWLDELLGALIKARLVDHKNTIDALFDGPNAPLKTFSARINFAFALGLVHADERSALHIVRSLRNAAAHFETTRQRRGFDTGFDVASVRDEVAKLPILDPELIAAFEKIDGKTSTRDAYSIGISFLVGGLIARLEKTPHLPQLRHDMRVGWRKGSEAIRAGFAIAEPEAEQKEKKRKPRKRPTAERG